MKEQYERCNRKHKKKLLETISEHIDKIEPLYIKAKQIRKLHYIQNTILMNGAYHEEEKTKQLERIKRTATDEEIKTINELWTKRHKLTTELIDETEAVLCQN